jgi:hypothetical protein
LAGVFFEGFTGFLRDGVSPSKSAWSSLNYSCALSNIATLSSIASSRFDLNYLSFNEFIILIKIVKILWEIDLSLLSNLPCNES